MTRETVSKLRVIEHRALFALSIAFTASITAYPDLPDEIPPFNDIGGERTFIGGPFLAFFLPIAALVIWWLLARLNQRQPESVSGKSAGAATALFLSAFHVTVLIALIDDQRWMGRILGLMVGVFLIAARNGLPLFCPNPARRVRNRQTFSSIESSSLVYRLVGYVRIGAGIAVCMASLAAMRLETLIVVAICLEMAVYVGSRMFFSRKSSVIRALLLCCHFRVGGVEAQGLPSEKIETLPVFMDVTVPKLMEQGHVTGTAVVIVHDGRIIFLRGYGKARLDTGADVDPSKTLFRLGSVTKLFTAAAALQLVDARKLDLYRDIREYLPDIPLRYGATTHQLLTHTAGLDEKFVGGFTRLSDYLQPLPDHLRRYAKQVIRPGNRYSYSSYNSALTGLLVERLSGLTYEQYIAERILKPLKMTRTTAHQPPEPILSNDVARGYEWTKGHYEPLPYRFTQTGPAGGMSATAADMGRFMVALLGDGVADGERILSPESVRAMLAPQYTPDARIAAVAYEFVHWKTHGQDLLHKDGTLGDHVSVVLLAPADKFGIFVASNGVPGVGNHVLEPLLTYLVGPPTPTSPPIPLSDARERVSVFGGAYRDYHHTRNDMSRLRAIMPMVQSRVRVEADGAIRWQGRRWFEVEPLVFRREDSPDYIVFRKNNRGDIIELHAWGATYERIGWFEQAPFHLGLVISSAIAFLAYALSSARRLFRGRRSLLEARVARGFAALVAVTNLIFIVGLAILIRSLGDTTPLSLPVALWLSLPVVTIALTVLLPAFAVRAWQENWWTRGERLGYAVLTLFAAAFMTFLNYWKLLGVRY